MTSFEKVFLFFYAIRIPVIVVWMSTSSSFFQATTEYAKVHAWIHVCAPI